MKNIYFSISLICFICFASCNKVQEGSGLKSLIDVKDFASNSTCRTGGVTIKSGIDKNKNNVLDSTEVDKVNVICNGQNGLNGGYDKQISIKFDFYAGLVNAGTTPIVKSGILKFSKKNYTNVDSIILVADPCVFRSGTSAILDLYNMTDNVAIANSTLTTKNLCTYTSSNFIESGNLYNSLPDKEVTLGIRLQASDGSGAQISQCYLFLYRK